MRGLEDRTNAIGEEFLLASSFLCLKIFFLRIFALIQHKLVVFFARYTQLLCFSPRFFCFVIAKMLTSELQTKLYHFLFFFEESCFCMIKEVKESCCDSVNFLIRIAQANT